MHVIIYVAYFGALLCLGKFSLPNASLQILTLGIQALAVAGCVPPPAATPSGLSNIYSIDLSNPNTTNTPHIRIAPFGTQS